MTRTDPVSDHPVERSLVWLCAGCDKCEPTPGVRIIPDGGPCTDTSPSMNGCVMVDARAYDDALRLVLRTQHARENAEDERDEICALLAEVYEARVHNGGYITSALGDRIAVALTLNQEDR